MSEPVLHHLRAGGVSLVLRTIGDRLPEVLHWGADLGDVPGAALADLDLAARPQQVTDQTNDPVQVSLLPELSAGWPGTPGLSGHFAGARSSHRFAVTSARVAADHAEFEASDTSGLGLAVVLELTPQGLVRQRATVTNHAAAPFTLDAAQLCLPVPLRATEVLDFTGHHLRERAPQRAPWQVGVRSQDSRRGRTGLASTTLMIAGETGFSFGGGEVWGVHTAWSGNHRMYAEHHNDGRKLLGGGELLLPGEIVLAHGEHYTTPWLYYSYGIGLDEMSARFHEWLRARPGRATRPRPVTLNTWEAVYFDQTLEKLTELADLGAAVGVERFVLDDGWFGSRRDDTSGLGDWEVSADVWPDGLGPLIDHVRGAGMEFGLWVEPEMINVDSDLAHAHPDWILAPVGRLPMEFRSQQVLNLTIPEAFAHIRGRLLALLDTYDIAYLKWDHNRDLIEACDPVTGKALVHAQTAAFYRLVDDLKAAHPEVEIESCASGGGRVDLEVLERTDRVWASDCIDPLERQHIQRWTGLLLPPELVGAHVASPTSHSTGRTHDLSFRAATAMFGHFGLEWDLTAASAAERARVAEWIAAHKRYRELLHTGRTVRVDEPDPSRFVHGIVAPDGRHGLFAGVLLATSAHQPTGPVTLAGLAADLTYQVTLVPVEAGDGGGWGRPLPWAERGVRLSGRMLHRVGLALPRMSPEHAVLLEVRAV
ncbi:alpha-galactosidase [Occultella gossypii]|uniref:alpha-galactosidase n=1 Tax=Occultella gossypii TaxID=2800820 RepID=A0ABS7SAX5_9MICO|nr:alpha-galactosidase [Occultella gossypii]MBZ2197492.1 alpha-galactosidase [Occultella gossypii]